MYSSDLKVAICCASLHDPLAILFDEPLTGLDPRGIRTLKESITERARNGAAVMVSSHLLSLVEDLCTHLLVLNLGKACFFGPTDEARRVHPNHRGDASLEEVFFQLTEGGAAEPPPVRDTEPGGAFPNVSPTDAESTGPGEPA